MPADKERLGRLLLKLSLLADLNTNSIEEIFFVGLIGMDIRFVLNCIINLSNSWSLERNLGSVKIHKIIPCILKMNVQSSPISIPSTVKHETNEALKHHHQQQHHLQQQQQQLCTISSSLASSSTSSSSTSSSSSL